MADGSESLFMPGSKVIWKENKRKTFYVQAKTKLWGTGPYEVLEAHQDRHNGFEGERTSRVLLTLRGQKGTFQEYDSWMELEK